MTDPGAVPNRARRLLERMLPPADAESLLGDLEETGRADRRGAFWYWRQTLAALWALRGHRTVDGRRSNGDTLMWTFLHDLRIATRALRHSPGFTLVTVVTLALGIGATAAMFSVLNPILLRPLPYPDADQLVMIWENPEGSRTTSSWATSDDLSRRSTSFTSMAKVAWWQPTLDGVAGDAEVLRGQRVGWNYFQTLGISPVLGRSFRAEEDTPDGNAVVVLSDGLWRRRYGADPAILGSTIGIDGLAHTVVGVMPHGFENVAAPDAQIWRPLGYIAGGASACRTCRHIRIIARLEQNVSREQAALELDRISIDLNREYPGDYRAPGMLVIGLHDEITRQARPVLMVVLGAVGFLLLAACANVAHLLLTRALRRERELAVRAALGASRWRLGSQFLAESVMLALLGGMLGVIVAVFGVKAFVAWGPSGVPRLDQVRLDASALGVTAGVALGTALLLALTTTLAAVRTDRLGSVASGGRIVGARHRLARSGLVAVEIALALMLLTGAGLMGRSVMRLLDTPIGLEPGRLLTVGIQTGGPRYADVAARVTFFDNVRREVAGLPGVTGADVISQMPLGGGSDCSGVHAEDRPLPNPQLAPCAQRYNISADWFRTTGIRMRSGRPFAESDRADAPGVVIVSQALARKVWGDDEVVGKRMAYGGPQSRRLTVVGVAQDVPHSGLDDRSGLAVYLPHAQAGWPHMTLVVRTEGDPGMMAAAVRAAIGRVDGTQPIGRVATMDTLLKASTAQRRFALLVFGAFAVVALVLAAAGIGGVLAGMVAERTREIGIRSALGAAPSRIVGLIVRQAGGLTVLGVAAGLAGAIALSRFLRALLYEVRPVDPVVLTTVVVLLLGVALAACVMPARRALGIDPMEALRRE